MTMERVGVQAVVDGVGTYLSDANRVNNATAGMARQATTAADSWRVFSTANDQAMARLRQSGAQMREAGTQAIFLGGALAAPGAISLKLALDFESAFAGVRKTVDATEPELQQLRTAILDMSLELPTSANAIAAVAEAAGQLGIATNAIADFTKTAVQLGETTNLSSEEAANGLARLANIIQLPQDQFGNLGSALVDLGNKSASTEAEILDFALRIAGAGNVVGLTADEILSFAAGLSSVGLASEAGGTAISRTLVEIATAVDAGGAKLQQFAEVAGLSVDAFTRAFRDDAAGATVTFIEGLGRINAEGGSVFAVLEELSLADVRLRDALLRAAGAGDLLRSSLATGAKAFRENTALTEEFSKRVETGRAQLALFINEMKRAAIEGGDVLLPVFKALVAVSREMVDAFSALPAPVGAIIIGFTLLAGGVVIATGVMGLFAGTILNLVGLMGVAAGAAGVGGLTAAFVGLVVAAGPVLLTLGALAAVAIAVAVAHKALTPETTRLVKETQTLQQHTRDLREETERLLKVEEERREAAESGQRSIESLSVAERNHALALAEQHAAVGPLLGDQNDFRAALSDEELALLSIGLALKAETDARRENLRAKFAGKEASDAETDALGATRGALEMAADETERLTGKTRESAASQAFFAATLGGTYSELLKAGGAAAFAASQFDVLRVAALEADAARQLALSEAQRPGAAKAEFEALGVAGPGSDIEDIETFGERTLTAEDIRKIREGKIESNAARFAPPAAGGGGAREPTIAEQRAEARKRTLERQQRERVAEFFQEGERGLNAEIEQQARFDAIFNSQIGRLQEMGVKVPEALRDMIDGILEEAEDAAKKEETIGGVLGFLIARRIGRTTQPQGAGLISVSPETQARLSGGGGMMQSITIENVNVGTGTTTGDIAQGVSAGMRTAFSGV